MIGLLLCIIGALAAFFAGRRSLAWGCLVVIAAGYAYGILRANLMNVFAHFIFDAAAVGLYAAVFLPGSKKQTDVAPHPTLNTWMLLLMGWPMLLVFLPFQEPLVSIVGLRGNIFMLPAILIGARLQSKELRVVALGMAALNLVALGFGIAETLRGIEPFFPPGPMTITIYNSQDSGGANRIPATFQNAHTYAGVLVATIPFLFGAWVQQSGSRKQKLMLVCGLVASFFGVLMAATRSGMIAAFFMVVIAATSGKMGAWKRWIWMLVVAGVVVAAMNNDRWQRYKELDSSSVTERIAGSVNRTFLEILFEYPMGNGLGGGGTSIPYFLASHVNRPVSAENEYARVLLEQGLVGLALWVGFAGWFLTNRVTFAKDAWLTGRRMAWYLCAYTLLSSTLGLGMLSSIPNTFLFLMSLGWCAVSPAPERVPAVVTRRYAILTARGVRA